ncbi:MAG: ABC transporter ATP-binding protein [Flavobacteriia bacterium]|nr:ABC transporter ATP-binding protein [Flavobacteriia bacterium]OJX36199.1 MAG: hypothetical protein BGO87_06975 [Flavobacteriia bacterium 40-80]
MIQLKDYKVKAGGKLLFRAERFSIEKGEICFLVGKNGSGKSTFLKSLIRHTAEEQTYLIEGKPSRSWTPKELAKKIAYVPSKIQLNDFTRVEDFLMMGRYPYGKPFSGSSRQDEELVNQTLRLLQIEELRTQFIHQLSDGQQQLVSIGRALVQEVDYLLLDEPTAFLDYYNKVRIFRLAEQLSREKNMGIIVVTHDIEYLVKRYDQITFIDTHSKTIVPLIQPANADLETIVKKIYGD